MARFLFVVPPFVGHINPTIAVGQQLREGGHQVAWVGLAAPLKRMLPGGFGWFDAETGRSRTDVGRLKARFEAVRGFRGFQLTWEEVFFPLSYLMRSGVERAVADFNPDVLISDQQALAGALVARRLGLSWATSASTPATRLDAVVGLPKVAAWLNTRLEQIQSDFGVEPCLVPEDSPRLVLCFAADVLASPLTRGLKHYRYLGPVWPAASETAPFPWSRLVTGPRVLVSLGTLNAHRGGRLFSALSDALGNLDLQVILAAPPEFGPFPPNFIVQPWLPQRQLLSHVDLLLTHGGANAVGEALAYGRPLILFPITQDQPMIAQRVGDAGCGVRLSFSRATSAQIGLTVQRALSDENLRASTARVAREIEVAGGRAQAAQLLEDLVSYSVPKQNAFHLRQ